MKKEKKTPAKNGGVKTRSKRFRMIRTVFFVCFFIFGAALAFYPFIGDMLLEAKQSNAVESYESAVKKLSDSELEDQLSRAQEYNSHGGNYYSALNFGETMCVVEIPKIGVRLPVYHGCSSTVLDFALGHVETSSLPVGGKGTHCVITGHTGLSRVRIFDDLEKLAVGDEFTIEVLNQRLIYKIDQIKTVLPNETEALQPIQGEDHVTLVTCTPYGINSHRLLVRGTRVGTSSGTDSDRQTGSSQSTGSTILPNEFEQAAANRSIKNYIWIALIAVFAAALVFMIFFTTSKNRKQRKNKQQDNSDGKE